MKQRGVGKRRNKGDASLAASRKILLIDDEPEFVEMMQLRLEANNYKVTTAGDGEEGLKKALTLKPDLVLLDIMMPGVDGIEVLRTLRKHPEMRMVPVIMLTARGETKSIFRAQDAGATEYVIKPCETAELLRLVKKHITPLM
jgi:DNA-binding response OmpR family regulator